MKEVKKILIFIDWFLPGTKSGGPVRSCTNLIDHLGDAFDFYIITRDTDYCEIEPYKNIQSKTWNQIGDNTLVYYISNKNLNYKFLKNLIASIDFDIAYINGIYSKFFSILPVYFLRNSDKRVIVATRGMLNSQAFSVRPVKKKTFLWLMNMLKLYKNVNFHATNEDEANFIKKVIKNYKRIKIAPNLPRKLTGSGIKEKIKKEPVTFISVARVAREKGTLTALKALLQVKSSCSIIYDIYGPVYDQGYWEECKEIITGLPSNIQVNYLGSVAGNEVPGLLKDYHFFIMPSAGENFGHGILEALTAGCPVIISDKTPWKNLKAKEIGWDCSLANNDLNFALEEAITMNQNTYNHWSRKAYEFAKEFCDDPKAIEASRQLFL